MRHSDIHRRLLVGSLALLTFAAIGAFQGGMDLAHAQFGTDCEACYSTCGDQYATCLFEGEYDPGSCPLECETQLTLCFVGCWVMSNGVCNEDPGECQPT